MAKLAENRPCAFTESSKSAWLLVICIEFLLKSGESWQENASACNGNGAASDANFFGTAFGVGRLDVDAAGAKHLVSGGCGS